MCSKGSVPFVKQWKLQRIDHTTDRIDDASGEKPEKGSVAQTVDDRSKGKHTDPAEQDVEYRGKPHWAVDKAHFKNDA